jgi:hypothetical protein
MKPISCDSEYVLDIIRKREAGSRHNTPPEELARLANDAEFTIREEVAGNISTPTYVLAKLSDDEAWSVRFTVAYNENTPISILEKLATDVELAVQYEVAYNKNTPDKLLMKMAENIDMLPSIVNNENCPEIIKLWYKIDGYAGMTLAEFTSSISDDR